MTNQIIISITSVSSIVMMMIAVIFTYRMYLIKQFNELRNIAIGFLLSVAIPLSFGSALFIQGSSYNTIRTIIGVSALIISGLGAYIIWRNILSLRGESPKGYQSILEPVYFFGLGFLALNLKWKWLQDNWIAVYQPSWGIFIAGLPTTWVTFELAKISYKNLKEESSLSSDVVLNTLGFFIIFGSIPILMIERIFYPGSTVYFVALLGLGDMLISISLLLNPYVVIPNTIRGKSLVISDKKSGGSIIEYHFQKDTEAFSSIFPGAMNGILGMLAEITGRDELPPELGYVNLKIVIEESENLVAYLIVEQSIDPLRKVLQKVLTFAKEQVKSSNRIDKGNTDLIRQKISVEFDFIR